MVQVIKYPCCGKVFAACRVPECYEDADWQREMRAYIKKGCTVDITEQTNFDTCTCVNKWEKPDLTKKPVEQLEIF